MSDSVHWIPSKASPEQRAFEAWAMAQKEPPIDLSITLWDGEHCYWHHETRLLHAAWQEATRQALARSATAGGGTLFVREDKNNYMDQS
jgi:hypothetical protein